MFLFRADVLLTELESFAPGIVQAAREAVEASRRDLDFLRLGEPEFERSPSQSIDYAVMEKTSRAAVVPADIGWSDLGSWASLWEVQPKDENGNVTHGQILLEDVKNCYVSAERRLVAALGVEDLVIVETADAVLVARKDRSQDVKKLVDALAAAGRKEHVEHRKMYRPWGSYEGIDREDRFQVKRITVKPGARLSMQQHHHRAEHWVVVHGTAEVTVGDSVRLLTENESVYIPLGAWHRLHNPGRIPLHLVEVQSGSYLEEDDIVRTEDVYGRQA